PLGKAKNRAARRNRNHRSRRAGLPAQAVAAETNEDHASTRLLRAACEAPAETALPRRNAAVLEAGRRCALSKATWIGCASADVLWRAALNGAAELSQNHTPNLGTGSLDVLHVACALELRLRFFLTFDQQQQKLAAAAGLKLLRL